MVGGCLELMWQKLKKLGRMFERGFWTVMGFKLTRDLRDRSSDLPLGLCPDGQRA